MGNITYVCGHRNPDTDSIVAAISYAALQNMLGEAECRPVRLGSVNDETAALLKRFGFEAPELITDVRTQVRDIAFDRPPCLDKNVSVSRAWDLLRENHTISALPVINKNGTLFGLVTAGGIAESDMRSIQNPVLENIPIYNILSTLEGHILNGNDTCFESVSGEVHLCMPTAGDNFGSIQKGGIILCGQQPEAVEEALERGAACVILCQTSLGEKYRDVVSDTCVITTPLDVWQAARMLYQATPILRVATKGEITCFHLDDYLDDVKEAVLQSRFRSYPVLDSQDRVVGTLSRYHLIQPQRKRIVLVDHNEVVQSVPGLEQAELIAIIDHHRIADVQTGYPAFMRNEPVGSTNTIIATMFQEQGLMPEEKLAGLMAAAIISDTVMFKSPTTTPRDRRMAERLAKIAGLELETLGQDVFSASIADKTPEALLKMDFKEFHLADHKLAISQITTLDSAAVLLKKEALLEEMEKTRTAGGYDMVLLMITDVLKEGTELLFVGDQDIVRQAFSLGRLRGNRVFLKGVMSRKKQMVPALALLWG